MTVTLVVALARNGVIGVDGDLPWRLPADLAHFKKITFGHPMVMGRATYESIGRPLPGRTTIVLTGSPTWRADGVEVVGSLAEALALAATLDDEVFVVGGAQVYAAALESDLVDVMVVTHVDLAPEGDTVFGEVDWSDWLVVSRESHEADGSAPAFEIVTYARR